MQETMQTVKGIDWDLIRNLYLSGLTPKTIESKTGVKAGLVSVRANRGKWREQIASTAAMVKGTGGDIHPIMQDASKALTSKSELVRSGLASVLTKSVEKLQALVLKSPAHALAVNEALEPLVRNARAVFAWGDSASPAIRINVLGSVSVQSGQEASFSGVPVGQGGVGQPLLGEGGLSTRPPSEISTPELLPSAIEVEATSIVPSKGS